MRKVNGMDSANGCENIWVLLCCVGAQRELNVKEVKIGKEK